MRPLALVALVACNGGGGDPSDADGDGYLNVDAGGEDCDDSDATVHPDAEELCDELDHDCDGGTGLEDPDADGSPDCEDCADNDARRSPLNTEVCDDGDLDEDCDGLSDDDDPDLDLGPPMYPDEDGDGHGDSSADAHDGCDAPADFVADNTDCDDDHEDVPGTREVCHDGRDNDCDGTIDVCASLDYLADSTGQIIGDSPAFAQAMDMSNDVTGDGLDDLVIGSPTGGPGAAYVFSWPLDRDVPLSDNAAVFIGTGAADQTGQRVATGDVTGDGDADVLVMRDRGFANVEVRILPGPVTGSSVFPADGITVNQPAPASMIGGNIAVVDINADGIADLVVGTPLVDVHAGRVHILYGPIAADAGFLSNQVEIESPGADARLGDALAAVGDTDGDGDDDLLVSAHGSSGGAGTVGMLTTRDIPGTVALADLTRTYGGSAGENLGKALSGGGDFDGNGKTDIVIVADDSVYVVAPISASTILDAMVRIDGFSSFDSAADLGDMDGDGFADLLIGGRAADGSLKSWLLHGPWDAGNLDLADLNDGSGGPWGTVIDTDVDDTAPYGVAVAGGGDLDGDGVPDFAVSVSDESIGQVGLFTGWLGAF